MASAAQERFRRTITLSDAQRINGPVAFNVMLKPAGSLCNLNCNYCYYLDKADIYGGHEPRMTEEVLEQCVRKYIEANEASDVNFCWHGGEPLVMGLDFYRKAVEFQKRYGEGKNIHNTLQTNGTLLTREAAEFFRDNDFLLGISLDGPGYIHDRYRKDKGGAPTFGKVMDAIRLMQDCGTQFNTMSTVNRMSEGHGLEVYQFLKSIGSHYMQFMPVVEHTVRKGTRDYIVHPGTEGARIAPWSVSPLAFGKFLCDIFDEWVCNDVGQYYVNHFDCTLAMWCGMQPGTCTYGETCGGNAIVEHNGDLYACDHFVYPEYRLGNVLEDDFVEMMTSEKQIAFGISKRNMLPRKCLQCKYYFACRGECPKHRFNRTDSGETGLNALCDGYFKYFTHVAPYMDKMKELLASQLPPAMIIPWARMKTRRSL